jgi:alkylation response protein AidB-like acyl-CoA dehydrogenase
MHSAQPSPRRDTIRTLPDDRVRRVMWRLADRPDLQKLIEAARGVARGPVARLVAEGARATHEWTDAKAALLQAYDEAGLTSMFADSDVGGYLAGPKNLALALAAFELAWVDSGGGIGVLAQALAAAPIHERGTPEQRRTYIGGMVPPGPGETRRHRRGAFCLTEPIPYAGVETGLLGGKVRVAEWKDAGTPILQVDKRGRFTTNMAFADFVTASVESADDRIKGTLMVILEDTDPGTFDRGAPTRKLVNQLSSTRDPVFSLRVPADRIVGGYTIRHGVLVPNYTHHEIIEAVFRRTRVSVGVMTAAKLLSAVEPIIRYHRSRFRGVDSVSPGSVRHELGLQQRQDTAHRLADIWAMGEASASMGFAAARLFDEMDPLERRKDAYFASRGLSRRAKAKALGELAKDAAEYVKLMSKPPELRNQDRFASLGRSDLIQFMLRDAVANVMGPAVKLWNTGCGAAMMREAASLMGGYGITADCPGFLGHKWMDTQLEAIYEGPEAVQRRLLSNTMSDELFLAQFRLWVDEMHRIAADRPGTGACTIASAMQMWLWTLLYVRKATDADGGRLYQGSRQGVTFPMADALCWVLASRCQILDVLELERHAPNDGAGAEAWSGFVAFFSDLCHVQAARAAGEVGRVCAELLFGYRRHPAWDAEGCATCYRADELEALEEIMPGIGATAWTLTDVVAKDGTHAAKAGPCAGTDGLEPFLRMRSKMDGCLTGSRLAKDRAAEALTTVAIPEKLDYPRE